MKALNRLLILWLVLTSTSLLLNAQAKAEQCPCQKPLAVFGVYEMAYLENINKLQVEALVDSGATTTAMDARNVRMYVNRSGERWVHYDFEHKGSGAKVAMHQPVTRVARIITHSGGPTERAVVHNRIRVGNKDKTVEMSLINRSNFPQQLLIGRNFLRGTALIDSGRSYLQLGSGR